MKIIANPKNVEKIRKSYNRIVSNCEKPLGNEIENMPIIVTDNISAQNVYSDPYNLFQKAFNESFGCVKGNIKYENEYFHLIVLNIDNIEEFELSEIEFDGIFSHELGHIFNENPKVEIPSVLNGHAQYEVNEAKHINLINSELYSDFFSKKTKCSQGLISSIQKFMLSKKCQNKKLFNKRLENLESDQILEGFPKILIK